jgi:hypothetical protein
MSKPKPAPQRPFVPPSPLVWDDERLNALDKEQLANLLANVPAQLAIGRISEETASDLERRIRSRIPPPSKSARQKRAEELAAEDTDADHEEEEANES